jgi:hypothetical protein
VGDAADETEVQHALSIRILGLVILVLAAGGAAMSYLSGQARAEQSTAATHLVAAARAVSAWYQDPFGGHGSYRGLSTEALIHEAPAVSSKVHVTVLAGGRAFCLDDEEGPHSAYYVGGNVGRIANLNGATPFAVTPVRSSTTTAAAICANAS